MFRGAKSLYTTGQRSFDKLFACSYFMCMQTVCITDLKDDIESYLQAVSSGETVLDTERGRILAEIVPPRAGERTPTDILEALAQRGLVTLARHRLDGPPQSVGTVSGDLSGELVTDREDR